MNLVLLYLGQDGNWYNLKRVNRFHFYMNGPLNFRSQGILCSVAASMKCLTSHTYLSMLPFLNHIIPVNTARRINYGFLSYSFLCLSQISVKNYIFFDFSILRLLVNSLSKPRLFVVFIRELGLSL